MEDATVYKDPLTRITALVKDTFKDGPFKSYYEGDPIMIPDASFPCLIIEKIEGTVTVDATGTDVINEKIHLKLIFNKQDDFGATDDYELTERKLRRYVEARDPTTGYFLPNTLMFALRTNITLGNSVIDSDIDINYDLQPRPEKQVTSEAVITMVVRERVTIPNRL